MFGSQCQQNSIQWEFENRRCRGQWTVDGNKYEGPQLRFICLRFRGKGCGKTDFQWKSCSTKCKKGVCSMREVLLCTRQGRNCSQKIHENSQKFTIIQFVVSPLAQVLGNNRWRLNRFFKPYYHPPQLVFANDKSKARTFSLHWEKKLRSIPQISSFSQTKFQFC